ncbi:hypothetical protein Nmel_000943, partial [Mimus melanotis]
LRQLSQGTTAPRLPGGLGRAAVKGPRARREGPSDGESETSAERCSARRGKERGVRAPYLLEKEQSTD